MIRFSPRCRGRAIRAFTLTELLVVLVIMATLVMAVAPYATRSHEGLSLEQECLSVAEAARFALQCASDRQCPTRLVVDLKRHAYRVEIALDPGRQQEYRPIERLQGLRHILPPGVRVYNLDGFTPTGGDSYLTFNPAVNWPTAEISLLAGTTIMTVTIQGKRIDIMQEPM